MNEKILNTLNITESQLINEIIYHTIFLTLICFILFIVLSLIGTYLTKKACEAGEGTLVAIFGTFTLISVLITIFLLFELIGWCIAPNYKALEVISNLNLEG